MNRLPIKMEYVYSKKGSFKNCNPFAIVFVYTKHESYVVKGGINAVEAYFKMKITEPAILHQTLWHHGVHRISIKLLNIQDNISIYSRKGTPDMFEGLVKSTKWLLLFWDGNRSQQIKAFKRFPRKWIKELDAYLNVKQQPKIEKPRLGRMIEPYEV